MADFVADYESDSGGSIDDDFKDIVWKTGARAGEKPEGYVCTLCVGVRKRFKTGSELVDHKIRVGHPYCKRCDEDFTDHNDLEYHIVHSNRHISCVACHREFQSEAGLDYHIEQVHKGQGISRCPQCFERFTSQSAALRHMETNICAGTKKDTDIRATILENQASTAEALRKGREERLPTAKKVEVESSELIDSFAHFKILDDKKEVLPPVKINPAWFNEEIRQWRCPYARCGRKFRMKISFEQHLNSETHQVKNFVCPGCNAKFSTSSSMLQHIESRNCRLAKTSSYNTVKAGLTVSIKEESAILSTQAGSSRPNSLRPITQTAGSDDKQSDDGGVSVNFSDDEPPLSSIV